MQDELSRLFGFEADFAGALPCVPMAVRFKLDTVGVKISLKDWVRMTAQQRNQLLDARFGTAAERERFRQQVCQFVRSAGRDDPALLPIDQAPPWQAADVVPAGLRSYAQALGTDVPDERWAALTPLRRFVLIKLSRPKHDNVNFLPALREFNVIGP